MLSSSLAYYKLEMIFMPRRAKRARGASRASRASSTGIYHVMLRGINRQIIFEDNEDYEKLIQTITQYQKVCEYEELVKIDDREATKIIITVVGVKNAMQYIAIQIQNLEKEKRDNIIKELKNRGLSIR
ncbi:MAG: hypothetical protein PHD60_11865 [Clostridia bacterium]|nr:hypothetical protein [Clostridia bacterium]